MSKNKNILITGGAGFIGSNLVRHMVNKYSNYKIINLDCLTYAGNLESLKDLEGAKNYKFIKGDITDKDFIGNVFKDEAITHVMHLAAESHVDRSILGPEEFLKTNIMGTFNLLENAKQYWGEELENKKFLHVSTDEVYGSLGDTGLFTETTPYSPNSPYSASKASSDHIVRAYYHTYCLPVVTTNCSNNYGPFQFPEKLIPVVIMNAIAGFDLPVYGDGLNIRDWLYVNDHCEALDLVLHDGKLGEVYNVGGSNEWTNIDIIKTICSLLDDMLPDSKYLPHANLIKFIKDRPGHDRRYAIDSSKILSELGWTPKHQFEDGIKETIKWYLGNADWMAHVRSGDYEKYYEENYSSKS